MSDKPLVVTFQPELNSYYPAFSMRANEMGHVEVVGKTDEGGNVYDIAIAQSSSFPRLDRAAVSMAEMYKFRSYVAGDPIGQNNISFHFYFSKKSNDPNVNKIDPPTYPAISNKNDAVVRLVIDEFGVVESVKLIQSTGNDKLDNEAIKVGRSKKMRSMIVNGYPKRISTDLKVSFGK